MLEVLGMDLWTAAAHFSDPVGDRQAGALVPLVKEARKLEAEALRIVKADLAGAPPREQCHGWVAGKTREELAAPDPVVVLSLLENA